LKAEIISIGTELLLGETVDTNSNFLASQLPEIGIDLLWITQIGDNTERIISIFKKAINRSDIIFVTGGLGPTEDDITRESLAKTLKEKLSIDSYQEKKLRNFFVFRNRTFPIKNIKQAAIIPSAKFLNNPVGTAPGWWVKTKNTQIFLMPGPPSEMQKMWNEQIKKRLLKGSTSILVKKIIKISTLGESTINEMVEPLLNGKNPSVGIYVKKDGVSLRIAAKAKTKNEALKLIKPVEKKIKTILSGYIWGEDSQNFADVIQMMMIKEKFSLGIIESVTGGSIANEITNINGSSKYFHGSLVAYHQDTKIFAGVKKNIIKKQGTISKITTEALAKNALKIFNSSLGLGITGIAGNKITEEQQPGTIFIAITNGQKTMCKEYHLPSGRNQIKNRAVFLSFTLIREFINEIKKK
jgi:nicotinamide-nucleotide amidase